MADIHQQKLLILDFGSQYTQLIARRVREIGVYCEIWPYDVEPQEIEKFKPRGVILSGGPETVLSSDTPRAPENVFELGVPLLGICYGMQTMAAQLGGEVEPHAHREFGYAEVESISDNPLLQGIEDRLSDDGKGLLDVWMSHGDRVIRLPENFIGIASTAVAPFAAMANLEKHFYGLQFHPEVTHTSQGGRILERFVREICACDILWNSHNIIEDSIARVREKVGADEVILGLSGGVDSSVVAALLHQAIGDQLTCVFVDTGLLRQGESDQVMQTMAQHMGIKVIRVDAASTFIQGLSGHSDPEKKRKIIGNTFIDIFEAESEKLPKVKWLAQGTIYPDVIESAGSKNGKAHVIKSHHNVGGLPDEMQLELLEPLRELFKDEVRRLGVELGLPFDMVYRHPFPGPGLAVRMLGEIKPESLDVLRRADHIFIEELRKQGWYDKVSQAFAVWLPVKSVGVVGDARRYDEVIALRAVETVDFMTARWARLPHELLDMVVNRILNEVPHVSRVVYDISGKPPATIEWE